MSQLGLASWWLLMRAVETAAFAANPGKFVYGGGPVFRELAVLEAKGWVRREPGTSEGDWALRLTDVGRLVLLDDNDPEASWSKPWDGRWRMLVFDLPARPASTRTQFLRWLRENRYGCLQGSLWISPHPMQQHARLAQNSSATATSLILAEADILGGTQPKAISARAWSFKNINHAHRQHIRLLNDIRSKWKAADENHRAAMFKEAVASWNTASMADPFLPRVLLPSGYMGEKAWTAHKRFLFGR